MIYVRQSADHSVRFCDRVRTREGRLLRTMLNRDCQCIIRRPRPPPHKSHAPVASHPRRTSVPRLLTRRTLSYPARRRTVPVLPNRGCSLAESGLRLLNPNSAKSAL